MTLEVDQNAVGKRRVEVVRYGEFSGTQAEGPQLPMGRRDRLDFRNGLFSPHDEEGFARLDTAEATHRVPLYVLDANGRHDMDYNTFPRLRKPAKLVGVGGPALAMRTAAGPQGRRCRRGSGPGTRRWQVRATLQAGPKRFSQPLEFRFLSIQMTRRPNEPQAVPIDDRHFDLVLVPERLLQRRRLARRQRQ